MFKVGDVVRHNGNYKDVAAGETGVITEIGHAHSRIDRAAGFVDFYLVTFPSGTTNSLDNGWWLHRSAIELVEAGDGEGP